MTLDLSVVFATNVTPKLEALLAKASARIKAQPELLGSERNGTYTLRCPLPAGYQPTMYRWATELAARIGGGGEVIEIAERADKGSGGYMGSCIPTHLYETFFSAWLEVSFRARQLALF